MKTKQNNFTLIPRWVGGKINWPGQLTPPPTPATKHTELCDKKKTAEFDELWLLLIQHHIWIV